MLSLAAIILAAGAGRRFGKPKWQIALRASTFLASIIENLSCLQLAEIVCVCRDDAIRIHGDAIGSVRLVVNANADKGGIMSSIVCGVGELAAHDGYLIYPVDHPFVQSDTLVALECNFKSHPDGVIVPKYHNLRGHPIIMPQSMALNVPPYDISGGLKRWLQLTKAKQYEVAVEDDGILKNINCPSDLP